MPGLKIICQTAQINQHDKHKVLNTDLKSIILTAINGCDMAGWFAYNGSCYLPVNNRVSWIDAREDCRNKNADLVVIETEEEDAFVRGMCI